MNTGDQVYWQIVTTILQINALIQWMDDNHENLEVSTILFLGYTIRKLHLYAVTVGGIVREPTYYQVRPRLIF